MYRGINQQLPKWNVQGCILFFLNTSLERCSFYLRLGDINSNLHILRNGVLQGSVLSLTLFVITIKEVANEINLVIHSELFADDLTIYIRWKIRRHTGLLGNEKLFNSSSVKINTIHLCSIRNCSHDRSVTVKIYPLTNLLLLLNDRICKSCTRDNAFKIFF